MKESDIIITEVPSEPPERVFKASVTVDLYARVMNPRDPEKIKESLRRKLAMDCRGILFDESGTPEPNIPSMEEFTVFRKNKLKGSISVMDAVDIYQWFYNESKGMR